MNKLKLCPFCGRAPRVDFSLGYATIYCSKLCGATMGPHKDKRKLESHWNKRVVVRKTFDSKEKLGPMITNWEHEFYGH